MCIRDSFCGYQIPLRYPVTDQLADQLEPSLSRYLEPVCDLLSTKKSRKLVADPHELVESQVRNQVCDLDSVMEFGTHKSRELVADPHELDGNRVCDHVCNPASVMEFCLKREATHPLLSCETAT